MSLLWMVLTAELMPELDGVIILVGLLFFLIYDTILLTSAVDNIMGDK